MTSMQSTEKQIKNKMKSFFEDEEEVVREVVKIPTEKIRVNPKNFYSMETESIEDLADSIEERGQISAGRVFRLQEADLAGYEYELIDGERRYRACVLLERDYEAYICEEPADEIELELILIHANKQRIKTPQDLRKEIDRLGNLYNSLREQGQVLGMKKRAFQAKGAGVSESTVYNVTSTEKLIPELQQAHDRGELGNVAAYELAKLPPEEQMSVLVEDGKNASVKSIEQYKAMNDTAPGKKSEKSSAKKGGQGKTPEGCLKDGLSAFAAALETLNKTIEEIEAVDEDTMALYEKARDEFYRLQELIEKRKA